MIPKLLKLSEFLEEKYDGVEFVVSDLLPSGGLSLLGGHPKAGKSTLVRNLIRCVARGHDFLGRQCVAVPVLYYALEELPHHVAMEFISLGCAQEEIYLRVGPIDKDRIHRLMEDDITRLGSKLAVIDPLFDVLQVDDINTYTKVNDAMKKLLGIARYTSCHIMAVHHTNKSDARGGNSILGSQALAGATDCNMFLTIDGRGHRIVESQQRAGTAIDRTILTFDPVSHSIVAAESLSVVRAKALRDSLLESLGDMELSTIQWRDMTPGRSESKLREMKVLEDLGYVETRKDGRLTWWKKHTQLTNT